MAAATQNQALSALLFLYEEVLAQPLPWLEGLERAKRPVRRPTVLTEEEARRLLAQMRGTKWLMASLLYGAGLRLRECLKLWERGVRALLYIVAARAFWADSRQIEPDTDSENSRKRAVLPQTPAERSTK
ncbi:MAG TPA: hypothetical protein VNK67_14155 [Burkholderiales bacterium]|nr:hypothetical protein [Burkholderiales bacterium]